MRIFATSNSEGMHTGFFEEGFSNIIPADAFEVTEDQRQELLSNPELIWLEGQLIEAEKPSSYLDDQKAILRRSVDQAAETERLKYITPGNGQAMTYQQKVTEAQAFKAATNPKASDYPMLSSEVGITAETIDEVADVVLAAFAQWQQIGAMIESIRLGAKRDIDASEVEAEARAIVDAIIWPSGQVQS